MPIHALWLLGLILLTSPALAQEQGKAVVSQIKVPASASTEVVPDMATIRLAVMTERKTSQEAAAENARSATKVIEEIKALKIEARDVRTVAVTVAPVFGEEKDASGRVVKRTVTGYRALNSLEIRVREIGKVGPIAQQLIDKGGNVLGGISFSVSDAEARRDQLRAKAMQEALRRAKIYTDAIGVKLGRVIEIEPESEPADGSAAASFRGGGEAAPAAIPVEPGVQTLSTRVTVTWQIAE